MQIVYDAVLKRPACAILQAAYGIDSKIVNDFKSENWLIIPTPNLRVYEVSKEQLNYLLMLDSKQ